MEPLTSENMSSHKSDPNARKYKLLVLLLLLLTITGAGFSYKYFNDKDKNKKDVVSKTTTSKSSSSTSSIPDSTKLSGGFQLAKWADNVTVTYGDDYIEYKSDSLPNHERQAEYALPNGGGASGAIPTAATSTAGADPTKAQTYDFKITNYPKLASKSTPTSLGTIGVMISGAALFNPYEGDGKTVATNSNFTVKNSKGQDIAFLDSCNGHPNPMGAYHYHALPSCVTSQVDSADGPSHIIGIAFDGFPIYGDRDNEGKQITVDQLDECNGISSPTPEFPKGVYHYVLLNTKDSRSSILCLKGEVDESLTQMNMGNMGGPPQT